MKARTHKLEWVIPLLGIALVGGSYFPVKCYLGLKEKIRSGERLIATVDRLSEECCLNRILIRAQESGCQMTARSVDELLTANLATETARLPSADTDTRALVTAVLKHIDRKRSEMPPTAGEVPAGGSKREVAAQTIPTQSVANWSLGH